MPAKKKMKIHEKDQEELKESCVYFVANDMRPFHAVESVGMKRLLETVMNITKKYPMITRDDLNRILPCRKTVVNRTKEKAETIRQHITQLFLLAIANVGGFSCTTDMWTDNYKRGKYICLTAQDDFLRKRRFFFRKFRFLC